MTTSAYGDVRIQERRGAGVAYRIGLENRSPAAVPGPRVRIPVPPCINPGLGPVLHATRGNASNAPATRSNTSGSRVTPPLVLDGTPVSSSAARIDS